MSSTKFPVIGVGGNINDAQPGNESDEEHFENGNDSMAMATDYSYDRSGVETVETEQVREVEPNSKEFSPQLPSLDQSQSDRVTHCIDPAEKRNSLKTPPLVAQTTEAEALRTTEADLNTFSNFEQPVSNPNYDFTPAKYGLENSTDFAATESLHAKQGLNETILDTTPNSTYLSPNYAIEPNTEEVQSYDAAADQFEPQKQNNMTPATRNWFAPEANVEADSNEADETILAPEADKDFTANIEADPKNPNETIPTTRDDYFAQKFETNQESTQKQYKQDKIPADSRSTASNEQEKSEINITQEITTNNTVRNTEAYHQELLHEQTDDVYMNAYNNTGPILKEMDKPVAEETEPQKNTQMGETKFLVENEEKTEVGNNETVNDVYENTYDNTYQDPGEQNNPTRSRIDLISRESEQLSSPIELDMEANRSLQSQQGAHAPVSRINSIQNHRVRYSIGTGCAIEYQVEFDGDPKVRKWIKRESVNSEDLLILNEYEINNKDSLEETGIDLGKYEESVELQNSFSEDKLESCVELEEDDDEEKEDHDQHEKNKKQNDEEETTKQQKQNGNDYLSKERQQQEQQEIREAEEKARQEKEAKQRDEEQQQQQQRNEEEENKRQQKQLQQQQIEEEEEIARQQEQERRRKEEQQQQPQQKKEEEEKKRQHAKDEKMRIEQKKDEDEIARHNKKEKQRKLQEEYEKEERIKQQAQQQQQQQQQQLLLLQEKDDEVEEDDGMDLHTELPDSARRPKGGGGVEGVSRASALEVNSEAGLQSVGDGYNTEFEDDSEREEEKEKQQQQEQQQVISEPVNKASKQIVTSKRKHNKNKHAIDLANDVAHQRKMNAHVLQRIEKLISMTAGEGSKDDDPDHYWQQKYERVCRKNRVSYMEHAEGLLLTRSKQLNSLQRKYRKVKTELNGVNIDLGLMKKKLHIASSRQGVVKYAESQLRDQVAKKETEVNTLEANLKALRKQVRRLLLALQQQKKSLKVIRKSDSTTQKTLEAERARTALLTEKASVQDSAIVQLKQQVEMLTGQLRIQDRKHEEMRSRMMLERKLRVQDAQTWKKRLERAELLLFKAMKADRASQAALAAAAASDDNQATYSSVKNKHYPKVDLKTTALPSVNPFANFKYD